MRYTTLSALLLLLSSFVVSASEMGDQFEYPYYAQSTFDAATGEGRNEMMILNSGIASLQKRIEMIQRAKESIELEYFIYKTDLSGQLLITELIKRAQEGIQVRILLDKSITIIDFDEYYAQELRPFGVEVRYYNRAVDPSTAQFRNHRKLLSIDGVEAMTGGRNIGLEYFDLDPEYNFHDRDIWVKGPIAKAMIDSFEEFWNSGRAVIPVVPRVLNLHRGQPGRRPDPRTQVHERRIREAQAYLRETAEVRTLRSEVQRVGRLYLNRKETHVCPQVTFISDRPTGTFLRRLNSRDYKLNDRLLNQVLKARLLEAREKVVMETPYFMINQSFGEMMGELLDRGVEVTALTNSLGSTDAIYVSTNFYRQIGEWITRGLRTMVHTSLWDGHEVVGDWVKATRYGIHSKTFVIDDLDFTIGTYNVDNRSDFYNTEMTLFCEGSPELAEILLQDINWRITNSYRLTGDGSTAVDQQGNPADAYGGATPSKIRLMKGITLPARLLEFLM